MEISPQQQAVEAIVRIIRITVAPDDKTDFNSLSRLDGIPKFDERAQQLVVDFVANDLELLTPTAMHEVVCGRYEHVWGIVNFRMEKEFGLTPVKPVALEIDDLPSALEGK